MSRLITVARCALRSVLLLSAARPSGSPPPLSRRAPTPARPASRRSACATSSSTPGATPIQRCRDRGRLRCRDGRRPGRIGPRRPRLGARRADLRLPRAAADHRVLDLTCSAASIVDGEVGSRQGKVTPRTGNGDRRSTYPADCAATEPRRAARRRGMVRADDTITDEFIAGHAQRARRHRTRLTARRISATHDLADVSREACTPAHLRTHPGSAGRNGGR